MGTGDDEALRRLTEHLSEMDHRDHIAVDEVPEHIARPHRRQLIRVPDHDELAAQTQRLHQ